MHNLGYQQVGPSASLEAHAQRQTSRYYLPLDVSGRFGQRLKTLRHMRNMTQSEMAESFQIDRSFISSIERGQKAATLRTLELIASGMNMTLSELLRDL